jgi:hypothetical protein
MQKKELIGYLILLLVFCIAAYLIYSQTSDFTKPETVLKTIPLVPHAAEVAKVEGNTTNTVRLNDVRVTVPSS